MTSSSPEKLDKSFIWQLHFYFRYISKQLWPATQIWKMALFWHS